MGNELRVTANTMYINEEQMYLLTRVEVAQNLRGQGLGSKMLDIVCQDADHHGVVLFLSVAPDETPGSLNHDQLMQWYESRGFQEIEDLDWGTTVMVRFAKNVSIDARQLH